MNPKMYRGQAGDGPGRVRSAPVRTPQATRTLKNLKEVAKWAQVLNVGFTDTRKSVNEVKQSARARQVSLAGCPNQPIVG